MRRSAIITKDALRVGALAIIALAILTYAVIRLGRAAHLFSQRYTLVTFVGNAAGLREGGQVTVAGQLAGSISKIEFLPVSYDTTRRLRITVQLDESMKPQVRLNSRVVLRNQGLLGDRFFDITPGTPQYRPLHEGDTLRLGNSVDYEMMIQQASAAIGEVVGLTHDVRGITQGLVKGQGTVGQLLTSRELYDRLNGTLGQTSALLARLQNPNGSVGRLLDDPAALLQSHRDDRAGRHARHANQLGQGDSGQASRG